MDYDKIIKLCTNAKSMRDSRTNVYSMIGSGAVQHSEKVNWYIKQLSSDQEKINNKIKKETEL